MDLNKKIYPIDIWNWLRKQFSEFKLFHYMYEFLFKSFKKYKKIDTSVIYENGGYFNTGNNFSTFDNQIFENNENRPMTSEERDEFERKMEEMMGYIEKLHYEKPIPDYDGSFWDTGSKYRRLY